MAVILILPVLLILGVLVYKGAPILSLEFLFTEPTQGMTAGGIMPALVGTVWLVAVALLASVPIGVAAALYLSEYAPDNTLTRIINLAIINLAGVPSIVHALFGVGAFVALLWFWYQHPRGLSDPGRDDTAHHHRRHQGITAGRPAGIPRGVLEHGRDPLADHPAGGVTELDLGHPHRRHPRKFPERQVRPHRSCLPERRCSCPSLPQGVLDQTMAMSLHLYVISTTVPDVPEALPYGVALVLIGMVLTMNAASVGFRMYLRNKRKW